MFVNVNGCVSEFLSITEDMCFCFSIHKPHDDVRFVVPCISICSWLFVDWVSCGNVCFGDMQIEFVGQERYRLLHCLVLARLHLCRQMALLPNCVVCGIFPDRR